MPFLTVLIFLGHPQLRGEILANVYAKFHDNLLVKKKHETTRLNFNTVKNRYITPD